jgi:hypothetical protein
MRSSRVLLAVAVLLLAPVLTGCGDDDSDDGDDDTTPSESSPSSPGGETESSAPATTDATTAPAELPRACDVLTSEDVAAAYGVEFGPAEPGGGATNEQDLSWQSDNCDWEAEDLVEVQLALSGPEDYTPAFACQEPTSIGSTVEPVSDLGDQAWWEVDDFAALNTSLRVCTADYNFDIDLEYEDGVDFQGDPMLQSIALAQVVLAKVSS